MEFICYLQRLAVSHPVCETARRACPLVCPFSEIPASNSPTPAAIVRTAQSAWNVLVIVFLMNSLSWGLPWWLSGKEYACRCRHCWRCGSDPWVRKIPWRRERQPTPVFLPGKSRGFPEDSLVHGFAKESDMT